MSDGDTMIRLSNGFIEVGVAVGYGPRVIWCSRSGGANLFAELGDRSLEYGDGERYLLRGGHRLWVGPEIPELTYQPEDGPVAVESGDGWARVTAAPDGFGLAKSLEVRLGPESRRATIDHTITARGSTTLEIAPWAITLLRPGGVGILPLGLPGGPVSEHQVAHQVMLWPYTDLTDPALRIVGALAIVDSKRSTVTKIGTPLLRGWMAYSIDEDVFVKRAGIDGERFVDLGATGQIFANDAFLELETLGPIGGAVHGETLVHRETWELYDSPDVAAEDLPVALGLDGTSP